ncbi:MAG: guanylate kinase [Bradymonadaceae bacterium]
MNEKGILLIVCGPSGVGKTSLSHELLERHDRLQFSVSYTTRDRREHEVDGEDYHFVDTETFEEMRDEGAFAEWAEVHGSLYGTPKRAIREAWRHDRDLLFDIDFQGARQLNRSFDEATGILVIPPDMETLEDRLRGRGSETSQSLDRRLSEARHELAQYDLFDYAVCNDDFDHAARTLSGIYLACRHKMTFHRERIEKLVNE